ncbi:hypothetical protein Pla110_33140 [Polystyrenella longa]|uniref:RAMP superfamily protein n=1 Tax=Polystyrenella longa TaxID=2528007 RepID=A0A518CQR5_9PLAN|nr:hypothetical protein [Polystyrenella longa]QDU81572.1 hypothetical protein Pla110_33140 [Polystyrenella longa]
MRTPINVTIKLESYIAKPFWPETSDVIDIEKKSGLNRCRTESTRETALKSYLKKEHMTLEDYQELKIKAKREWHRLDNDNNESPIVIPRHHLAGCLVETVSTTPAAVRGKFKTNSFRHHVRITDFLTEKTKADGVFDRYVKLETSNQRNRQRDSFIENVVATGTIQILDQVNEESLKHLFAHALSETGIGSSRKMGYGRGEILSWN